MYQERDGIVTPTWRAWLTCYTLYVLLLVLSYVVIFLIWREALVVIFAVVMSDSHWTVSRLFYLLGVLAFAFGGFIYLMVAEPYLRGGVECRQLKRRFKRLFIPLAVIAVAGIVARVVLV